jgi:hypothetical protein
MDPNEPQRQKAVTVVQQIFPLIGLKVIIEALIPKLATKDPQVFCRVVSSLSALGPLAVNALRAQAIRGGNRSLRLRCIGALEMIGRKLPGLNLTDLFLFLEHAKALLGISIYDEYPELAEGIPVSPRSLRMRDFLDKEGFGLSRCLRPWGLEDEKEGSPEVREKR